MQSRSYQELMRAAVSRGLIKSPRHFKPFIDYLPLVSPPSYTYDVPHLKLIAEHLDKVTSGEIDRLAIFLPPRHAKSETVTMRYPVQRIEDDPTTRILITGYNERFAKKFGRRTRQIAIERGVRLTADKKAADEWDTPHGGGVVTRGVGSPPTGYGFHLIVVDDPIRRREDAESDVYRDKVFDWYTDDLFTRLEPGGAIILVLTRWHHDDIAARAIATEPGRWTILSIPALAEEFDPLGREPGEALWPERYSSKALNRIRKVMAKKDGEYSFLSLYQQQPTPREGAFFKVGKIEIVDAVPANLRMCRGWDLASTKDKGDYTVGVKIGVDSHGVYYVTDVRRGQWSSEERDDVIKQTAKLDKLTTRIRLPQDPSQAGKSQARHFMKLLAGHGLTIEPVSGKKEVRAQGFASQVNLGNVKMLADDEWNSDFIEELRQFNRGKHDDQVDAASDAFNELALNDEAQATSIPAIPKARKPDAFNQTARQGLPPAAWQNRRN